MNLRVLQIAFCKRTFTDCIAFTVLHAVNSSVIEPTEQSQN